MKPNMRYVLLMLITLSAWCAAPVRAGDLTQVYYPTQSAAQFTIAVPSDWTLTPQGEEGAEDYFEVEGPNGLELSFRTVPGADIDAAVQAHIAYLTENFTDIVMGDARETSINGMEAILLPAHGKDEDGAAREFGAGWFKLGGDAIGELWYNVDDADADSKAAAVAVLNSLKAP